MSTAGFVAAVSTHLRDPLRRSSYALVLGTALSSALGFVFWAIAARWLPAPVVGVGAALMSAVVLLANLSTLGLRNGLIRFLPAAGRRSLGLILRSYAICALTALIAAGVFLLGQPVWAANLGFLRTSPAAVAAFLAGAAFWVVFVLQDQVLIGLRLAVWVPLENVLCSLAKIAVLPVLALAGGWAVFGASVLPAVVAVVVVTALVARHLRRRPEPVPEDPSATPDRIPLLRLIRFAAADHLAALLWMSTSSVLTLVVLQAMGPAASAYYYLASMAAYTLYLITSNTGSVLVAEGSRTPDRLVELTRQAFWNTARLVLPLAVVGVVAAPWVLRILGPGYAEEATTVLRLLLVSALPQMVVGLAVAAARVRHDLRMIMIVYAVLAVGGIGGSWLMIDDLGLAGVGLACLGSQLVVALALLVTGRTGLTGEMGTRAVLAGLEQLPRRWRRHRSQREARRRMAPALAACGLDQNRRFTLLTSDSDTLVAALDGHPEPMVIKVATSGAASAGLERHAAAVAELTPLLPPPAAALMPRVLQDARVGDDRVLIETRLAGETSAGHLDDPRIGAAAVAVARSLHEATATAVTVDDALLDAWVTTPVERLGRVRSLAGPGLTALAARLTAELRDREVVLSAVHGDFWPGNVLVDPAADPPSVSGIVDWENASCRGLPDADLLHWWLSVQPVQLGAAVARGLNDPAELAARLAEDGIELPNPQLDLRTTLLLTWLWHVSAGLNRTAAQHLGQVWLSRNVRPIVALVGSESVVR